MKARLWINSVPHIFRVSTAEGTKTFSAGKGIREAEAKAAALEFAKEHGGTFVAVPQGIALAKLEGFDQSTRVQLANIPAINPAYGQVYTVEFDKAEPVGNYLMVSNMKFVVEQQQPNEAAVEADAAAVSEDDTPPPF